MITLARVLQAPGAGKLPAQTIHPRPSVTTTSGLTVL
jgi:hypothetical protein